MATSINCPLWMKCTFYFQSNNFQTVQKQHIPSIPHVRIKLTWASGMRCALGCRRSLHPSRCAVMRNLLKIGLVANIFEWYEFAVYAYMADIIGQLFFKSETSVVGLAKAFTIFAIGYLIRPLGSLVWGTVGDRIGRGRHMKTVLMMSD